MLAGLTEAEVAYVVIGGVAATVHGSARVTNDLDICYDQSDANTRRLAALLASWDAYPWQWPDGLPFFMDARTFRMTPTMTLNTSQGRLDVLHRVEPIGDYAACRAVSTDETAFGHTVPVLDLAPLIAAKRYANRPKDRDALPELEALLAQAAEDGTG
jgi:hypothetical protein